MTMGDRITPTRPRRLDPAPATDSSVLIPAGPVATAPTLPTQPEPRPATEPTALPAT